jgi:hypothetical protein
VTRERDEAHGPTWRVGRKLGRTVYFMNELVGIFDTANMAKGVVDTLNARRVAAPQEGGPTPAPPVLAEALRELADEIKDSADAYAEEGMLWDTRGIEWARRLRALAAQAEAREEAHLASRVRHAKLFEAVERERNELRGRILRGMLAEEGAQCEKAEPGTSSLDTPGPDHRS